MQGRYDGHVQLAQESQYVTARAPSKDAILVLQRDDVDIVDIQKIGGASIRLDILFRQLESNARRVLVTGFDIVDRQRNARRPRIFRRHCLTQVCREGGNAALARQVVANKRDAVDL